LCPTYTKGDTRQLESTGLPHESKWYIHGKETTSPLAITVKSNGTGYNAGQDVDGDSEQVGGGGAVSELYLGMNADSEAEFIKSDST